MEEILELQRQLAQAQNSSNLYKISERVIVDIVNKLIQTQDLQLFFTKDGQEYIIPDHLDTQIYDIIMIKGRCCIIELPELMNIGIEKIESRLPIIMQKYKNVQRLSDFMITNEYLDRICEEINEDLQQKSQILISEMSNKYDIPNDFMKNILADRLKTIFQDATIIKDKISTHSYQQRIRAKLRGILRAVLKPISIINIIQNYGFEDDINETIDQMIKSDEIDGKILQGMYVPTKFQKNQEIIVKNFFKQNDYVEYTMLQKQLFIPKPKDFLKTLFKTSCIFLESCCYNKDSLDGLKEQINSLLELEGYCDLTLMLPSLLTDDDIDTIINRNLNLNNAILEDAKLFSLKFLEKCTLVFKDQIVQLIYKSPQKLIEGNAANEPKGNKKNKKPSKSQDQTSSVLFTQDEVIKKLLEEKILDHGDRDDVFEECLYKLLLSKINQLYEEIKIELQENKKSDSMDIVIKLQKDIESEILKLLFFINTQEKLQQKSSNIDLQSITAVAQKSCYSIQEQLIVFLCKKQCLTLNPAMFQQKTKESQQDFVFKNRDMMFNAIDMLPKDLKKLMKELYDIQKSNKIIEFSENLSKNEKEFGIRVGIDKKSEKEFKTVQKYLSKEGIKANKTMDTRACVKFIILQLLNERNIYLYAQDDDNIVQIYIQVLLNIVTDDEMHQQLENVSKALKDKDDSKFQEPMQYLMGKI